MLRSFVLVALIVSATVLMSCEDEICKKNEELHTAVLEDGELTDCLRERKVLVNLELLEEHAAVEDSNMCETWTRGLCNQLRGVGCPGAREKVDKWCD